MVQWPAEMKTYSSCRIKINKDFFMRLFNRGDNYPLNKITFFDFLKDYFVDHLPNTEITVYNMRITKSMVKKYLMLVSVKGHLYIPLLDTSLEFQNLFCFIIFNISSHPANCTRILISAHLISSLKYMNNDNIF